MIKRWGWIVLLVSLAAAMGFADEDLDMQDAFSAYRPIYFIVGTGGLIQANVDNDTTGLVDQLDVNQMVKLGYSMKYQFFHQYKTGLYLGFTQVMYWDIFNESSPFAELNYNPDLFLRFESKYNFLDDVDMGLLRYVQVGVEHKSNGLAGPDSRAFDRAYAQFQLGVGDKTSFDINAKYFLFFHDFLPEDFYKGETTDLAMYRSSFEFKAELNLNLGWAFFLPHTISIAAGPGGGVHQFDFSMGYQQLDVVFGDVFGGMHPYIQVWNGYGEGLAAYDQSNLAVRAGILLR